MNLTKLQTARKAGFRASPVYRRAEPEAVTLTYLKQKTSFFIAAVSLVAFIGGNMVGQHGWYAFWKSVMGAVDDSMIEYTGMVLPIEKVPDYSRWSAYGGGADANTFRQVPKDLLVSLPAYNAAHLDPSVYSVGYMGSYATGNEADGSHPGVDIRVPEGTPVRAIAAGIVVRSADDGTGFGKFVVIRHPHVPDIDNPGKETVIFSNYAHLSAQYVAEGDIVGKGQEIGLSGMTGDATGPHLHFQIDRASAPWHPYWPFSSADARNANMGMFAAINAGLGQQNGFDNTLNPLVFIQSNGTLGSMIAKKPATQTVAAVRTPVSLASLTATRRAKRASTVASAAPVVIRQTIAVLETSDLKPAAPSEPQQASSAPAVQASSAPVGTVATVDIMHDGSFTGRQWEKVTITLRDLDGRIIQPDHLDRDLVVRTAYGEAEFRPSTLDIFDFQNGQAVVQMLPRGRRTVVVEVQPAGAVSGPMKFVDK